MKTLKIQNTINWRLLRIVFGLSLRTYINKIPIYTVRSQTIFLFISLRVFKSFYMRRWFIIIKARETREHTRAVFDRPTV